MFRVSDKLLELQNASKSYVLWPEAILCIQMNNLLSSVCVCVEEVKISCFFSVLCTAAAIEVAGDLRTSENNENQSEYTTARTCLA